MLMLYVCMLCWCLYVCAFVRLVVWLCLFVFLFACFLVVFACLCVFCSLIYFVVMQIFCRVQCISFVDCLMVCLLVFSFARLGMCLFSCWFGCLCVCLFALSRFFVSLCRCGSVCVCVFCFLSWFRPFVCMSLRFCVSLVGCLLVCCGFVFLHVVLWLVAFLF